jgi:hypothetical protein
MKHANVSGQKAAPSKTVVVKAAESKSALEVKTMPEAGVAPKVMASLATFVLKVIVTMTSPRVGVLKISVGMKRPSTAPSPATKGKQARLDVGPSLTSTAPPEVSARSWVSTELDDDRVTYCVILDSVPSESNSSSSGKISGSESILPSSLPAQNLHVFVEIHLMTEVPEDIVKLSARIVKKWWSSYGLPYVIEIVRIEPEVRFFGFVLSYSCVTAAYL